MAVSVILALSVLSCVEDVDRASEAESECHDWCVRLVDKWGDTFDRSFGPCLSAPLPYGVITPDFVCDVVTGQPDIDDRRDNQCEAYLDGTAGHIVEVDTNCEVKSVR